MSLPAADDLFRPTAEPEPEPRQSPVRAVPASADPETEAAETKQPQRRSSGRVRHDEKMTVYVTSSELHDLEHARLVLRSSHGLAVDRGRLVREALSLVLADFETRGEDSVIVRRLNQA
ncbi:conserved hypothetical protein [metagenome]|uniref:Cobyrinic acid a,c-diamide synthase n=1 Tax=metagenome TaxID=256318 RepID=A0A2P2CAI0_9ZZZZ